MWQLGFGRVVTTIFRRLIGRCRNVDFSSDEQSPVFSPESEVLYPSRAAAPVGPPMIQFVSLENGKAKSWSSRKNI